MRITASVVGALGRNQKSSQALHSERRSGLLVPSLGWDLVVVMAATSTIG
jgi:hypothetical protein